MATSPFDMSYWKLQLPVDWNDDGKPDEIKYPKLATYDNGDTYRVLEDRLLFRAYVGGFTTKGSKYPRSELREMKGKTNAAWCSTSGTHILAARLAVTHLPSEKPHIVVGQIHNSSGDVLMIRLEDKNLFVERDGDEVASLNSSYVLNTYFEYRVEVAKGQVVVYYDGELKYTGPISGCKNYFKAGAYVQSNPDKGDLHSAYGEAVFEMIRVTHEKDE